MLTVPLSLRHAAKPVRPACAWFAPGDSPERWLAQLIASGIDSDGVQLYVAPTSRDDRRPSGVLIVPGADLSPERAAPQWLHYGRQAQRLYLPIDAVIDPPVRDAELEQLLPGDEMVLVFHPTLGLVACDAHQVVGVRDLLAAAPPGPAHWTSARPGVGFAERLAAIVSDLPCDVAELLEESRDDIGRDAPAISQLPPAPGEPSPQLFPRAGQALQTAFARAVTFLTNLVPHTASQRTWINELEDWANRKLAGKRANLFAARNREILRLLHLLETAPDEGLRYALPLTDIPHRGSASPGARLSQRKIEFGASRGGGPADAWRLEEEMRQRLMQRYRDLANRELHLGRYGRAAYIFADLLGDFHAAAAALQQGGQFRAAAALYQERLKQPQKAAQCLEQGGLWTEAIKIYAELQAWETVGDLYAKLEQPDDACLAYRREVERRQTVGDRLGAARLLENRLQAPEEALRELEGAWPDTRQATECFDALFDFYARHNRHADARTKITTLADRAASQRATDLKEPIALVDRLTQLAQNYSLQEIAVLAADRTRVVAAALLPSAAAADRRRLVSAIGRLVPADRLLVRDCARFLQNDGRVAAQIQTKARPPQRNSARMQQIKLRNPIQLQPGITWKSLVSVGDEFVAAGFDDRNVVLARARWGAASAISAVAVDGWRVEPAQVGSLICLAAKHHLGAMQKEFLFASVHVTGRPAFAQKFVDFESDIGGDFVAHSHPAFRETSVAISHEPRGWAWIVDRHVSDFSTLLLSAYRDQVLLGTYTLSGLPDTSDTGVSLLARATNIYLGLGDELLVWKDGQTRTVATLPLPITSLAGSMPHTRPRIVATLERGVALVGVLGGVSVEIVANDMESPVATLTPGGRLIAADAHKIEVYIAERGRLVLLASTKNFHGQPIAVVATDHADRFAVCDYDGHVSVMELTGE